MSQVQQHCRALSLLAHSLIQINNPTRLLLLILMARLQGKRLEPVFSRLLIALAMEPMLFVMDPAQMQRESIQRR